MGFFDTIVDQAQAQTTASMTTKKTPMDMTADSLIILDDTQANAHLESALGLTGSTVPEETSTATTPVDFLSLGDATVVADTSSAAVTFDVPAINTSASTGFDLFTDESLQVSSEENTQVPLMSEISDTISEVATSESTLIENTDTSFALMSDESNNTPVSAPVVETAPEVTPESILSQAIASLKMISDTTDAKRQSALDLEMSLLTQISDEITAHNAKIASLEASAAEAKATAKQIELDGQKTKDRIVLLEKELETV